MKKIISMLTSVVLAFSVVSSAVMADYTPTAGMPAVKTQLTNITFDNIPENTELTKDSTDYISGGYTDTALEYPVAYNNGFTAVKDGTNTYVQGNALNSNLRFMNTNVDALANVTSLGISFKVYIDQAASNIQLCLQGSDKFKSPFGGDVTMLSLVTVEWPTGTFTYQLKAFGTDIGKGRQTLNGWTTIDSQYTCEESGDNFTLTLQKLFINGKEIAITPASKTITKVAGRNNFQNLGSIVFAPQGTALTNVLKYDDINIYIPENSVSSVNPANESKIFADSEVAVEYVSAPSATDVEGISLEKHNGTAFEAVAAKFNVSGNKAVLNDTLEEGAAYKLTVGDKTSIFTTFESYMPKAGTIKKAIFSNYETGSGIDQPYSKDNIFKATTVSKPIVGNSTVVIANTTGSDSTNARYMKLEKDSATLWENADSMIVSYEYDDTTASCAWGYNGVGLVNDTTYKGISDGVFKLNNSIFAVSTAFNGKCDILGTKYNLTTGYTKGWHKVDLQLTKEGVAWVRLDGTVIATNVTLPTALSSMADWGNLQIGINNWSGGRPEKKAAEIVADNIIAYVPQKDDIEVANASYTYDAVEKTVTITYDITGNNKQQTVTVIGAAYGESNRLTGVNKTTQTIEALGTAKTGETVTLENVTKAPNTVKLFVWDGFVNCVPLHDTIPVSKSE